MAQTSILLSGFGGQGILFAGKFLAYKGLIENKNVSWLPSYGPEMRGGTASCSVIISDEAVGSPIVSAPDVLVAMNLPSLDKFEPTVKKGGVIICDSTLIERKVNRDDVTVYYVNATKLADENGLKGLANMIILGMFIKHSGIIPFENIEKAMKKVVSAKRPQLFDLNMEAIKLGYEYEG